MRQTHPRPVPVRTRSIALGAVVVVTTAVIGVLALQPLSASLPSVSPFLTDRDGSPEQGRSGWLRGALGEADGAVPEGVTVFDDGYPAVTNLDPALLDALRQAATDAAEDGVVIHVNSGWRSPAYQQQLLDDAVSEHGSAEEAARWVATADTSPHVSGEAVDVGASDATAWLASYGAAYGLCQIYGNEPWHYELRPEAVVRGCPEMYADPTHDPRMQP